MCGICVFLVCRATETDKETKIKTNIQSSLLRNRGPDIQMCLELQICSDLTGFFYGSTLHFRGHLTEQPMCDSEENMLLWNGEIFDGIEIPSGENDGVVLLTMLQLCDTDEAVLQVLAQIHGPWGFIYWQKSRQKLWFGRDVFGRRSLLYHTDTNGCFALASIAVSPWTPWKEVPAVGIYCMKMADAEQPQQQIVQDIILCPWAEPTDSSSKLVVDGTKYGVFNKTLITGQNLIENIVVNEGPYKLLPPLKAFNKTISEQKLCGTAAIGLAINKAGLTSVLINNVVGVVSDNEICSKEEKCTKDGECSKYQQNNETVSDQNSKDVDQIYCGTHEASTKQKSHSETSTVNDAFKDLDHLADDCIRVLARQLIDVLQKAVLTRTMCQSDKCSKCIQIDLQNNKLDSKQRKIGSCTKYLGSLNICANKVDSNLPEKVQSDDSDGTEMQTKDDCDVNSFEMKMSPPTISSPVPLLDNANKSSEHLCDDTASDTKFDSQETVKSIISGVCSQIEEQSIHDSTCARSKSSSSAENLISPNIGCGHARVAVLFSGGVDSLVIAALADRCVPISEPIDLLNVAFEQQPKIASGKHQQSQQRQSSYDVPDRKTGLQGLHQLQQLNPVRKYNFVQINITLEELKEKRLSHVKNLVYPLNTVLDDSIGCAIWFASRGHGVIVNQSGDSIYYDSPARTVLVGMGADEQFAGYSRHRVKYNTCGWPGLVEEIQMEIERISSRNLGRDDRVISDHGRESRFPFLDENVVSFLNSLPLSSKTNLDLPRGIGEKFLLRLAAEYLGLTQGAMAPKRAIQFGSRIAKAENRKEKGSDSCDRL